jgi:hypothetical protein
MCDDGATVDICAPDPAHDAADSGNPLKIGGKALTGAPTAVTNNDRVNAWFNQYGALTVSPVGSGTVNCNTPLSAIYDNSTSGNIELVAISGSTVVYVCGYEIMAEGDVGVRLVNGTGTACATGETSETPVWDLTTNSGKVLPVFGTGYYFATDAGDALCAETDGAVAVQIQVYYVQQ